jgi:tetratricopeptide (TPR) repeat protein
MKRRCSWLFRLTLWTGFLTVLLHSFASPAEAPKQWVARAVSVQGTVEAQRVGETQRRPVQLNDTFRPGDQIRVQDRSRADVAMLAQDEFPAGPDWQGMVRQSIRYYLRGYLQQAFDSIANVPPDSQEPRFFAYRAQLLLAVGRVDEANADIERALRLAPNDSNALALQAIIAIVQNDTDKALAVAQKAVEVAPDSTTALIALSYPLARSALTWQGAHKPC